MRPLLRALALLALGFAPPVGFAPAAMRAAEAGESPAPPRIYRWVDANGVAHYTTDEDRIPASLRRRFGLPTQPLERKPVDVRAPGTDAPAPTPAEPSAGVDAWASQERGAAAAPAAKDGEAAAPAGEWDAAEAALPAVSANAAADADADRLARVELRIAELSAAIAADEDALSAWIGDPEGGDAVELGQKPEFREIATRLPKRIQELEALRRERDALASATP